MSVGLPSTGASEVIFRFPRGRLVGGFVVAGGIYALIEAVAFIPSRGGTDRAALLGVALWSVAMIALGVRIWRASVIVAVRDATVTVRNFFRTATIDATQIAAVSLEPGGRFATLTTQQAQVIRCRAIMWSADDPYRRREEQTATLVNRLTAAIDEARTQGRVRAATPARD